MMPDNNGGYEILNRFLTWRVRQRFSRESGRQDQPRMTELIQAVEGRYISSCRSAWLQSGKVFLFP